MSTTASFGISAYGFPLMSLNSLAPGFLPHYQFPSDPPISLSNSTAMSLPLVQIFFGLPPSVTPSPAPPLRQLITEGTFILPLIQPENPSKHDAETLQPPPGSSPLLPPPLQHQAQCLQTIHKTIQQFHQHLKAEQLDRKALQIIVLQHQNDFALLCYLLFSSVGTVPIKDTSVKNSGTSPPINPNSNPTSNALLLPCGAEPSVGRSTQEDAVGPTRAKPNNSTTSNLSLQPPDGMAP